MSNVAYVDSTVNLAYFLAKICNFGTPLEIDIFRQMMHMDPPMAKFTKNDGIISLMHCQEWNILFSCFLFRGFKLKLSMLCKGRIFDRVLDQNFDPRVFKLLYM